jgi:hypothetical protein
MKWDQICLSFISGGCGPKNYEFKFTFDCSIAIEFVELNLMLKSNQTLLNELSTVGNLAVKERILSVVHQKKSSPIRNIHVWASVTGLFT